MKQVAFFLFICLFSITCHASHSSKEKILLDEVKNAYQLGKSETLKISVKKLLDYAEATSNDTLKILGLRYYGNYYYLRNEHAYAIEKYIAAIKIARKDESLKKFLAKLYNNIAYNFTKIGYYDEALRQLHNAKKSIIINITDNATKAFIYENIAQTNLFYQKLDSVGFYIKLAASVNTNPKSGKYYDNYIQSSILLDEAVLSWKNMNISEAEIAKLFQKAIVFDEKMDDFKHMCSAYSEYSNFLLAFGNTEQAKIYAEKGLVIANNNDYLDLQIQLCSSLSKIFMESHNYEDAYKFAHKSILLKEKFLEINNRQTTISKLAEFRVEEQKIKEEEKEKLEEREKFIKTLGIGVVIIAFIIIFLLLSHSILVNGKFITYFGNVSLLIGFEFINLIFHPFLYNLTNHDPFLMLIILILIASFLLKVHHKLESLLQQLLQKNKMKRVEIAKKILHEENISGW
ncbi:MAG: hypothetical protein PSV16_11575 [Flavobacterium sp.]|nr:hypothetical protein [Flavobacterium sp.]